jgi:putative ubiquitin-RnfH superfamily antitoxin RatB of RatAB toxin-antitoxin module
MARVEPGAPLRVDVVFSPAPREVHCVSLELPHGSTLDDALHASGLADAIRQAGAECGIWGCRRAGSTRLRDGDRVECWRALAVDPMQARRLRHEAQRRPKEKRPAGAGRGA